ncbi:PorP/SprF family type IX secretion system membrane protein, partial [uncultured Algibacter sp.]|uniref:PorP/SprF family type IX secretion system membrane protein n=1 Tax=uncultured Algibacter sp. TaxID=298659 RepID=UPI0032163726
MKKHLLYIVLLVFAANSSFSQEEQDGVVAFSLPIRNSLKFNRYIDNPTFSFVREQNKYISLYNKTQWTGVEDAPQTYLVSYSGRFKENIGAGVGLFQQNNGLLTTFGGVLNFAYNVVLNRDSNLTFGTNVGVYQSGINQGKVLVNRPGDPSLANTPSNILLTANPGINYGTDFFDFGLSVNNLVLYNISSSTLIEENPEQGIQAHMMYTGYLDSRGFFDESKFSGLIRSEFLKDQTVLSGVMMLTVPKGIWAQAGYSTLYGVSAGVGLNISSQIAVEYNYEKALGDLTTFGSSHEISLAYKFSNKYRYDYSGDDDEEALLISSKPKRRKPKAPASTTANAPKIDRKAIAEEKERARLAAIEKAKEKAAERAKLIEKRAADRAANTDKAAADKAAADKAAADKAAADRAAADKAAADRAAADKAAADKAAADK